MDPASVIEIVRAQFPEVRGRTSSFLGGGCDSDAYEIDGEWVFRFPKRADVAAQLAVERAILPRIASVLPVPVPSFLYFGRPSPMFPFHFAGYRRLDGEPALRLPSHVMPLGPLASSLARSLSALHAFAVEDAEARGVATQPIDAVIDEARADALGAFEQVASASPESPLDAWRRYLRAGIEPPRGAPATLLHNDLAAEHVLIDAKAKKVTGIIDWSDVAIGEPAADFAGIFHWGGETLLRRVIAEYCGRLDAAQLACARYLAACRGASDVRFGTETGRPEYVAAGIAALEGAARL
ncbi:MAG: phosphotransferase [Acidobacteriota bacterium]|nr:phosphotransferase [Acidobacteriota bacterium]